MSFDLSTFANAAAEGDVKGKAHTVSRPVSQQYDPKKAQKLVDKILATYPDLQPDTEPVRKQGRRVDGSPIMLAYFANGNKNVALFSAKPGKDTAAVVWTNLEPISL